MWYIYLINSYKKYYLLFHANIELDLVDERFYRKEQNPQLTEFRDFLFYNPISNTGKEKENNIKVKLWINYLMMTFYTKKRNTPFSIIRFGLSGKTKSMQEAEFGRIRVGSLITCSNSW